MGISLFILLLCIFPINAQTPHTLYGYIFYSADTPANNFSIIVINHDRNETITEESKYIYKNQNYYQIEVGSPGLGWENGEIVEVKIEGLDYTPSWKGNATLVIDLHYPNQRFPDIHLLPPSPQSPQKPQGASEGHIGKIYNFSTVANDPSGYNISYGWDWDGDDVVDEWSNWLASGNICAMEHAWQAEGVYEIKVLAKNEYNVTSNWSPILTVKISRDRTPPNTYIINAPEGIIDYNTVSFEWSGEDDVTPKNKLLYSYILEGYTTNWSEWTYNTSVTFSSLPNGNYVFKVRAKDEAGNVDTTPAIYNFTVNVSSDDFQPPIIHILTPLAEEISGKIKIGWNVSDTDKNVSISIYYSNDNGKTWNLIVENIVNTTFYEWDTKAIQDGKYIIKICAQDTAGNIGCDERTYTIKNKKTPAFTALAALIAIVVIFSEKYHRRRKNH